MVTLKTNFGDITLELFEDKAPKTVENFLAYVKEGFYDDTIFHRVIDGFMIQGGGFTADMDQKDTKDTIENEANNGVANEIGTIGLVLTIRIQQLRNFSLTLATTASLTTLANQ